MLGIFNVLRHTVITELETVFDGHDLDLNCRGQVNLFHGVFFHDLFDVFEMLLLN